MKKIVSIILKIVGVLLILILLLLFTIPVIFKKQIKTEVEKVINGSVNANLTFKDYKLGFFKNFPNLSFSLENMYITGIDKFKGDTLAGFKSFDMVFNLMSLMSKSGYEIKAFIVDKAVVNALVLKDGSPNWDIMKSSGDTSKTATSSGSSMKILLRKVEIKNSSISYSDLNSNITALLKDFNFSLGGYLTLSSTGLKMNMSIAETTFSMSGTKYLNKALINASVDVLADLKKMKFTLQKNYFTINDLRLNFAGTVEMPKSGILTDLTFGTEKTSFKTLLSLVPAVYLTDYKDLKTSGDFSLSGAAKGIYSSADSTMPDVTLNLKVDNGLISYPSLPEKISNISINAKVFADGKKLDRSTVNVDKFHFELAGNPFDMELYLKTPMSDLDFKCSLNGKIDLGALTKAVPVGGMDLSGIIDMAVTLAGKLSMVEKEQYDNFNATGKIGIKNMKIAMIGYPEVNITDALLQLFPASIEIIKSEILVANKSDFSITGQIKNYLPYVFKNKTIKANLILNSKLLDGSGIMAAMSDGATPASPTSKNSKIPSVTSQTKSSPAPAAEKPSQTVAVSSAPKTSVPITTPPASLPSKASAVTTAATASIATLTTDTTSLSLIVIPKNIDLNLNASISKFLYDNINSENLKGQIIIKDGILSARNITMNILSGVFQMNADYDTRDTLKPVMKADLSIKNIGVKDAFNTFAMVQKLAPAAKGIDGKINAQLNYQSLLGRDMMPVINTIDGAGKIQSDQIQLIESPTFDKIKGLLKLGENSSNTFKDVNISFKIKEGRVFVTPFDVKLGNIKMNIGGDQGLDQTLNYLIKTEVLRSDLGGSVNSLLDNVSAQAAKYGIAFKAPEIIKVNFRVIGSFSKPDVAMVFGDGSGSGSSIKQVVGGATEMAKDKLRPEAEAQGDKLIKEAEVKGQQLHDEAIKASEKVKQEAAVQGQNLTKEAESKGILAKAAAQKGSDVLKQQADKRSVQLLLEADNQAKKLIEEAKKQKEELLKKN
jgi:hypothetical protein